MSELAEITYHIWDKPSQIICCRKGIFVFVKAGELESMQNKIKELYFQ